MKEQELMESATIPNPERDMAPADMLELDRFSGTFGLSSREREVLPLLLEHWP